eukprot:s6989_g6.t1
MQQAAPQERDSVFRAAGARRGTPVGTVYCILVLGPWGAAGAVGALVEACERRSRAFAARGAKGQLQFLAASGQRWGSFLVFGVVARYWPFLAQRDLEEAGLRPLRERPAEALEDGLHCGCLCLQRGSGRCLLQRGRAAAAAAGNWSLMTWPECNRNQEETWRLETSPRGAEVFHLSDLSRARAGPLGPLGPGPGPGGSGSRVTQRQSAPRSRIFRRRTSTRPTTGSTGSSR